MEYNLNDYQVQHKQILFLLKEGYLADLVIVDPDKKIVVDASKFASKGRNTPFDKVELYGEVLMTIKGGEIKYKGEF